MSASRHQRRVAWALSCYPRWWRDRYGGETMATIEDLEAHQPHRRWIASSLFTGAMRARLRGVGAPASIGLWSSRTRAAILVATVPLFVTVPLGLAFWGNGGATTSQFGGLALPPIATASQVALGAALTVIVAALVILAAGVFGWLALLGHIAAGPPHNRWRRAALAALPGLMILAGVGAILALQISTLGTTGQSVSCVSAIDGQSHCVYTSHSILVVPAASELWVAGFVLVGLGWLCGPLGVVWAVRRTKLPSKALRLGSMVGILVGLVSTAAAMAALAFGIAEGLQPYPVLGRSYVLVGSKLGGWWVGFALGFVLTAVVSGLGAVTARRSYQQMVVLSAARG